MISRPLIKPDLPLAVLYFSGISNTSTALENNDVEAHALLKTFSQGIGSVPNHEFRAGYALDGTPLNDWKDGTFTATHLCSLKVAERTANFQAAWKSQLTQQEGYFQDSVRLLSLIQCQ